VLLVARPQHSFRWRTSSAPPSPTAREVLVQRHARRAGFPDALAVEHHHLAGHPAHPRRTKVPPPLQRAMADDLMAAVFPDCRRLSRKPGRRIASCPIILRQPSRPATVSKNVDFDGLTRVLTRIHAGEIACIARDTISRRARHEILNAKPYAFSTTAPLEERRTQAVRPVAPPPTTSASSTPMRSNASAMKRVPIARSDELHDALLTFGFLLEGEVEGARAFHGIGGLHEGRRFSMTWERGRPARRRRRAGETPAPPSIWTAAKESRVDLPSIRR